MKTPKDQKEEQKAVQKTVQKTSLSHDYDDIIDLPHHVSSRHPQMSMSNRAAQFSPFAALTGYGDVIQEAQRITDQKPELTESQRAELDYKLQQILNPFSSGAPSGEEPEEKTGSNDRKKETSRDSAATVSITYFVPDPRKDGGAVRTIQGQIRRITDCNRKIILQDKTQIDMDCILDIAAI